MVLETDIADYAVKEPQKKVVENLFGWKKMSKGISNFQIEKALKEIDDPDINENFVGAFRIGSET